MSAPNGGPAFPSVARDGNWQPHCDGMTLRDYFAAKALAGSLAGGDEFLFRWKNSVSNETTLLSAGSHPGGTGWILDKTPTQRHAEYAYAVADAMLAAREARK